MPKSWHTTRIENRYGGGVPDVHVCAEGIPFWIELKTTKTNRVNVSSHQVAWNFAYCQSGGVSFFLVKALLSPNLYLFDGVHGRGLMEHGLKSGRSGSGRVGFGIGSPQQLAWARSIKDPGGEKGKPSGVNLAWPGCSAYSKCQQPAPKLSFNRKPFLVSSVQFFLGLLEP